MQNKCICLAAAGAAGAWGEPGNGIPPLSASNSELTEAEGPCL